MDIKLITFLKLIETQSYTQTAHELHCTQPAVTQHIKKLEEEYACELIELRGRSFKLTKHGLIMKQYALSLMSMETQLKSKLNHEMVPLHMGMTLSIADYYIPDEMFVTLYQNGYNCSVEVANTRYIREKLLNGSMDCAIIEGMANSSQFVMHTVCLADYVCVVSSDHPLANKTCTIEDLFEYPLVLREFGSGTREILEDYLKSLNYHVDDFKCKVEMGSFKLIKEFLKHTHGLTFVYKNVVHDEIEKDECVILDVKGMKIKRKMEFIYHTQSSMKNEIEEFYEKYIKDIKM